MVPRRGPDLFENTPIFIDLSAFIDEFGTKTFLILVRD